MTVSVTVQDRASGKVAAVLEACGEQGRTHLNAVAANAVANQIQRHVAYYARRKHGTASRLGAQPTGHYEKGSAAITSQADARFGTVSIPIPGITRAWKDLVITPKRATALTLPVSSFSYGRRVSELEAMGWNVFRPKGRNVLMGKRDGKTETLYVLAKVVRQPRDPSLLPTGEEIGQTAAKAMTAEIFRIIRMARSAA